MPFLIHLKTVNVFSTEILGYLATGGRKKPPKVLMAIIQNLLFFFFYLLLVMHKSQYKS